MSKIRFTDGVTIETSGAFRKLKLKDGWYVVGDDTVIPAIDEAEADDMVKQLSSFNPEGGETDADENDDQRTSE